MSTLEQRLIGTALNHPVNSVRAFILKQVTAEMLADHSAKNVRTLLEGATHRFTPAMVKQAGGDELWAAEAIAQEFAETPEILKAVEKVRDDAAHRTQATILEQGAALLTGGDPRLVASTVATGLFEAASKAGRLGQSPIGSWDEDWKEFGEYSPISSGIATLDRVLPIVSGELTLVGGMSRIATSTFALQVALTAALEGKRVMLVSTEMVAKAVRGRLYSQLTNIPYDRIHRGKLNEVQQERCRDAAEKLAGLEFVLVNEAATVDRIYGAAASFQADLLVIDYLQRLPGEGNAEAERIGRVALELSELARSEVANKPAVIAVSMLRKHTGAPTEDDLSGSGDVKFAADNILLFSKNDEWTAAPVEVDGEMVEDSVVSVTGHVTLKGVKEDQVNLLLDTEMLRFRADADTDDLKKTPEKW